MPLFYVLSIDYTTGCQNYDILSFPVTEIEEIFILKGVDAAIYGPKGKRGIIVVTTKRHQRQIKVAHNFLQDPFGMKWLHNLE